MNVELAAHILAKGKRLAPDRFPQPGPETAEVWAEALSELDFPPALWSEAVVLWSTKLVGDRMVTPRDLIGRRTRSGIGGRATRRRRRCWTSCGSRGRTGFTRKRAWSRLQRRTYPDM